MPTTVIYTIADPAVKGGGVNFENLMTGIFSGKNIEQIVGILNQSERRISGPPPTGVSNYYEAVVLNAPEGSPESREFERYRVSANAFTLFYDVPR